MSGIQIIHDINKSRRSLKFQVHLKTVSEAIVIYSTFSLTRVNVILTFKICTNKMPTF